MITSTGMASNGKQIFRGTSNRMKHTHMSEILRTLDENTPSRRGKVPKKLNNVNKEM